MRGHSRRKSIIGQLARTTRTITIVLLIPVLVSLGMNAFINAQGFSRVGMGTVLAGAVLNIVLDPIFIYLMHMGVRGAALATILSQAAAAA